jgi:anti-anti-sigma factor
MNVVSIHESEGQVVAALSGDIDISEVDRVSSQIIAAIHNDIRAIVVDLSKVSYLDSTGIQMLFDLIRRFHSARQAVAVVVPESSPLSTLLKITHVHEACPVGPTVEACFEAIGNDAKLY